MIRSSLNSHQNGRLHTILSFRLGPYEKFATDPLELAVDRFLKLGNFLKYVVE